jgi:hypothetical protein
VAGPAGVTGSAGAVGPQGPIGPAGPVANVAAHVDPTSATFAADLVAALVAAGLMA